MKPRDALFMTLPVLKNGWPWDFIAKTFRFKTPTSGQLFQKIVSVIVEFLYDELLEKLGLQFSMGQLMEK